MIPGKSPGRPCRATAVYRKALHRGDLSIEPTLKKLCENNKSVLEKDTRAVCLYYIEAIDRGDPSLMDALVRVAETESADIHQEVARLFRSPSINRPTEAVRWELKARPTGAFQARTATVMRELPILHFQRELGVDYA
jgi:hypothetical protein